MLEKILVTDEILLSAKIIKASNGRVDTENGWEDLGNGWGDVENLFQLRSPENIDNCDPEKFKTREAKIKRLFEIFIDALQEVNYDNYDFDDFNLYLGKFYESEGNLSKALNLYDICIKNDQHGQICFLWGKVRVLLQLGKTDDAFTIIQNKLYYLLDNWNMDRDRKVKSLINHLDTSFFCNIHSNDPMYQYDISDVSRIFIDVFTKKNILPPLGLANA